MSNPDGLSEMLAAIGVKSIDELFSDIPDDVRAGLKIPEGMDEQAITKHMKGLASKNTGSDMPSFLGAGIYNHFIPAAVDEIAGRGEFITSYTPYQAEISQGMLQALFEYQSMMSELTGTDAVNCSMYDASTALGEAALMCSRITRRKKFAVTGILPFEKRSVLDNYAKGAGIEVITIPFNASTGKMDISALKDAAEPELAGAYIESPNFFGVVDDFASAKEAIGDALLVAGVNPISLGILKPPAEHGADIVIGEGQALGAPMNYGGPLLGIFGCSKKHIRQMPGRIIGATSDAEGRRAFCMTLQTREQHIRRAKATSNICSNESLMAIAASVRLALLGGEGLRELALKNMERARELADALDSIEGVHAPVYNSPYFNEFPCDLGMPANETAKELLKHGIIAGYPLGQSFEGMDSRMLFCATEMTSSEDIEMLARAVKSIKGGGGR